MSQIPRSQFGLKKRHTASPMVTIPVLELDLHNGTNAKKNPTNGSSNGNGHKNGSYDDDVVIIEDECFAVAGLEEVIASTVSVEKMAVEEPSPTKKKRGRRSKDSTESKDSDATKKIEEVVSKSPEKVHKVPQPKPIQSDDVSKQVLTENAPAELPVAPLEIKEYKVVKMSNSELSSLALKRRSDRLQNASTVVNLSTASSTDQSTKIMSETLETPTERRVSGRRSTRPIDDIKFTYRTPSHNDSLNCTTNATIGSDVNNDSLLTTPGTDRKRRQLTESMENIDSPKRSRMDLSGLFSSFSSPVAMLRNKFKRTNIASTPIVQSNEPIEFLDKNGDLQEIDLNEQDEGVAAAEEELKVITTPIKKSNCAIM